MEGKKLPWRSLGIGGDGRVLRQVTEPGDHHVEVVAAGLRAAEVVALAGVPDVLPGGAVLHLLRVDEHAARQGWVLAACIVIGSASALVGLLQ